MTGGTVRGRKGTKIVDLIVDRASGRLEENQRKRHKLYLAIVDLFVHALLDILYIVVDHRESYAHGEHGHHREEHSRVGYKTVSLRKFLLELEKVLTFTRDGSSIAASLPT